MNHIWNHPTWSVRHEARLQTLLGYEYLLNELLSTEPDQKESEDPFDLINHKRSADQVLASLMRITPTEWSLITANAMFDRH